MRLNLALDRHLPILKKKYGPSSLLKKDSLLFQRLSWGAAAGGLATILLAESPVLDTMEMNLLEWRYRIGHELTRQFPLATENRAKDIAIITYDDEDQFDLESEAQEGGPRPIQKVLAQLIPLLEEGNPLLLIIDIDLSGKADPELIRVLRHYRNNIVLALSGNLDNPNDFPASELRKSVLVCAYDHLLREANGLVCRMPIAANIFMDIPSDGIRFPEHNDYSFPSGLAEYAKGLSVAGEAFESLPEVVAPLISSRAGVGPSKSQIAAFSKEDLPVYIKFRGTQYPRYNVRSIIRQEINPQMFAGKVLMLGTKFSQKLDNTPPARTPLQSKVANVEIQAESIATLTNSEAIVSFPHNIMHHLLLLLGAFLGALASALTMGRRTMVFLSTAMALVAVTQLAFVFLNIQVPVLPLLAVLMLTFVFGTLIYLDTDLRLRNKELAVARESMQVRAEEERQRIANDLHDETLPALSAVARMTDKLGLDESNNQISRQMREKLDQAISEMRRVINDLHPSVLETMGFKPALENLLAILERDSEIVGEFIDKDASDDYGFNEFTRLQLYRIVQESLNNVEKHSKATKVVLKILTEDATLNISIIDNGKGINPALIRKDSHGLVNIRQRAQLIGAFVDWKKPQDFDSGTEVFLSIRIPTVAH
jgi:signal transduction histidine kinase